MNLNAQIKELRQQKKYISDNLNRLLVIKGNLSIKGLDVLVKTILISISELSGVGIDEILSNNRFQSIVRAKKLTVYIFKNKLNYTYGKISNMLNHKGHAGVFYLHKQAVKLIKTDEEFKKDIEVIETLIDNLIKNAETR